MIETLWRLLLGGLLLSPFSFLGGYAAGVLTTPIRSLFANQTFDLFTLLFPAG